MYFHAWPRTLAGIPFSHRVLTLLLFIKSVKLHQNQDLTVVDQGKEIENIDIDNNKNNGLTFVDQV